MKSHKLALIPAAALAVGAFLFLAPDAFSADAKTKLKSSDTKFIQQEAATGAAMVRIAELGVKNAERADVKAFAGTLAADHAKANEELATLARSKGVTLSTEADAKHRSTYEKLEAETGAKFDKEFLAVIVSSHKKCVKSFEDAAEDTEDSEIRAWAAKTLPALQAHLEKAEELKSASTASRTTSAEQGTQGQQSTPAASGTPATSRTTPTEQGAQGQQSTPTARSTPAPSRNATAQPDNTARNARDRDARTLTPLNQGNSKPDIDTTAQIRRGILNLDGISVNARNVKIITNEGRVTLRGPVNTEEEKRLIGEIADRAATSGNVDNQLDVKGASASN